MQLERVEGKGELAVTFWGTGDAMGVPRVYCECEVCTEARLTGVNRRRRSLVHLEDESFGTMLIDCGPDWREQMELAGVRSIERMLLTHAHFDHIAGLAEWADLCRWSGIRGLAYAMPDVIDEILVRFPWLPGQIEFHPIQGDFQIGVWEIHCWKVNHGKNGHAYAFRFTHQQNGRSWAYCSDAIALAEEELKPLRNLHTLVLGTSFYKEPYPFPTRSVYDMMEACELMEQLKPERMILTHMSHDIDLRECRLPARMQPAHPGMRIFV